MSVDRCVDCKASLGTRTQETFPGMGVEKRCPECETQHRAKWMATTLPDVGSPEFEGLTEWEQGFVPSIKSQIARGRKVTEPQHQALERIYDKL